MLTIIINCGSINHTFNSSFHNIKVFTRRNALVIEVQSLLNLLTQFLAKDRCTCLWSQITVANNQEGCFQNENMHNKESGNRNH